MNPPHLDFHVGLEEEPAMGKAARRWLCWEAATNYRGV